MKKTLRVVLIILLILLILFAALCIWQRENISALLAAVKYSQEDISTLIEDNEKIVSQALEEYPEFEVPVIAEQEIEALEEGKITQDDLVEIVLGNTSLEEVIEKKEETPETPKTPEAPKDEPAPSVNNASTQTPAQTSTSKNGDEEVAALIAKIYILKQSYDSKLDSLVNQTRVEYWAIPKEQRKNISKQQFIATKAGQALAMEAECDAEVDKVLSELTSVLKAYGKDLSLIDSIRKAYANEKQLKKSYYITKYLD